MKQLVKNIQDRYGYAWTVLQGLVKTDFRLRYQGSFLGIAWSVLKPLMMFCVMYVVFGKFLRMSDGTPTYPVVLLLGIKLLAVRHRIDQHRPAFGRGPRRSAA